MVTGVIPSFSAENQQEPSEENYPKNTRDGEVWVGDGGQ